MKKVFVVSKANIEECDDSISMAVGVFSTKAKARKYAKQLVKRYTEEGMKLINLGYDAYSICSDDGDVQIEIRLRETIVDDGGF